MGRKWAIVSVLAAMTCGGLGGQLLIGPAAHASPAYLQPCSDKDKLADDPSTGTALVCTGEVWDQAPPVPAGVHRTGSPCLSAGITSASDDGYLIFCDSGRWALFHE